MNNQLKTRKIISHIRSTNDGLNRSQIFWITLASCNSKLALLAGDSIE